MKIVQPINLQLFAEDKPQGKEVINDKKEDGVEKQVDVKEQKPKSLEEIVAEEKDNRYFAKIIVDLTQKVDTLTSLVEEKNSGSFAYSEVKAQQDGQKDKQKRTDGMLEIPD